MIKKIVAADELVKWARPVGLDNVTPCLELVARLIRDEIENQSAETVR
jgi:hypothetical protein